MRREEEEEEEDKEEKEAVGATTTKQNLHLRGEEKCHVRHSAFVH